jgi:hypothetical protein
MFETFREIIDSWPSKTVLAEALGVSRPVVGMWYVRDYIPDGYWLRLVTVSRRRVKLQNLALLAERRIAA